jgi:hypothetical protein
MNRTMEDIQWRIASDDPLSAAWNREDALGRMLEEARETITQLTLLLTSGGKMGSNTMAYLGKQIQEMKQ